jgi:hypothetical protein
MKLVSTRKYDKKKVEIYLEKASKWKTLNILHLYYDGKRVLGARFNKVTKAHVDNFYLAWKMRMDLKYDNVPKL